MLEKQTNPKNKQKKDDFGKQHLHKLNIWCVFAKKRGKFAQNNRPPRVLWEKFCNEHKFPGKTVYSVLYEPRIDKIKIMRLINDGF